MNLVHKLKAIRDRCHAHADNEQALPETKWEEGFAAAELCISDELDRLIQEYESYVCVPMEPEERRLDRLCFSQEAGMPTREQARIIYQIVASD